MIDESGARFVRKIVRTVGTEEANIVGSCFLLIESESRSIHCRNLFDLLSNGHDVDCG